MRSTRLLVVVLLGIAFTTGGAGIAAAHELRAVYNQNANGWSAHDTVECSGTTVHPRAIVRKEANNGRPARAEYRRGVPHTQRNYVQADSYRQVVRSTCGSTITHLRACERFIGIWSCTAYRT